MIDNKRIAEHDQDQYLWDYNGDMNCREGCGACCIALSISSPLPGMPLGKPAGLACVNLHPITRRCTIWDTAAYPSVCRNFQALSEHCGTTQQEAMQLIERLELATRAVE